VRKINGDLTITRENANEYSDVAEVAGSVGVSENAKFSAPVLAKVGSVYVRENAKFSAPVLAEVSGSVGVRENAKFSAPVLGKKYPLKCPEKGEFIGYKKCQSGVIVVLEIPKNARRSSAFGNKCRAEFVDVIDVIGADHGISLHDGETIYRKGERVFPKHFTKSRWVECGGGIHFFMTRKEVEEYV
jgi:hypothetical protein